MSRKPLKRVLVTCVSVLLLIVCVAAGGADILQLPRPSPPGDVSLNAAIAARRSVRSFAPDPLTADQLAMLLWSAQGITDPAHGLRTVPSAGALYPLQIYVATPDGVFKYLPRDHAVRKIAGDDVRNDMAAAAVNQQWLARAPAVIVIAAVYGRTARKYGSRSDRYVHMEAGAALQNVSLEAVTLGLASCPVGAFDDDRVAQLMRMQRDERPLLLLPVGKPAPG